MTTSAHPSSRPERARRLSPSVLDSVPAWQVAEALSDLEHSLRRRSTVRRVRAMLATGLQAVRDRRDTDGRSPHAAAPRRARADG